MKILILVGTRPNFIKASLLEEAFAAAGVKTTLIHTGQHYDRDLSDVFFKELSLREPDFNLKVGSGGYKYQISQGVKELVKIIEQDKPDVLLTIGDSNPVAIGTIAAQFCKVKLAHYEAGLRSGNSADPEERNRVLADSLSDLLFCSTQECKDNLEKEEVEGEVILTGDILYDSWLKHSPVVDEIRFDLMGYNKNEFIFFTIHRKRNAYVMSTLRNIFNALLSCSKLPIIWPIHSGVKKQLTDMNLWNDLLSCRNLRLIPPVGYLQSISLMRNCHSIITDSVGLQIEAYFEHKHSIILRSELEYHSMENMGWSKRIDPQREDLNQCINAAIKSASNSSLHYDEHLFGNGNAARAVVSKILDQ